MVSKAERFEQSNTDPIAPRRRTRRERIAEAVGDETPVLATNTVRVDQLAHNPRNPRMSLRAITDMATSLLEVGQVQPLTVVTRAAYLAIHPDDESELPEGAIWVVVDGNRRFAGARQAGIDELAIHVNDGLAADADKLLSSALAASLQNEHLTPLEEAHALETLLEIHGSRRAVAQRIGKSHTFVNQRLALLELSEELQQQVLSGEIKLEDARKAAAASPENQQVAVREAEAAREARNAARRTAARDSDVDRQGEPVTTSTGNGASTADNSNRRTSGGNGASTPGGSTEPITGPDREPATEVTPAGAAGGNAASTQPASATPAAGNRGATPPRSRTNATLLMEWEHLDAIAAAIRTNLSADERRQLAALIVDD